MSGDQHCAAIIQQEFLKLGIHYQEVTFGVGTRLDLFGNLKHLLIDRKIEILDIARAAAGASESGRTQNYAREY